MHFKSPQRFSTLLNKFKPFTPYLRRAWSAPSKNRAYCVKDGWFFERGKLPSDGGSEEQCRWDIALDQARCGDIDGIESQLQIQQIRSLERIYERSMFKRVLPQLSEPRNVWLCGPADCGKSAVVSRLFRVDEDVFDKQRNKWWDGYRMQPVVCIQDFDRLHGSRLLSHMKIWADVYPFACERKGGSQRIRPFHLIVTSNVPISEAFADHDPVHIAAVQRRFKQIDYNQCHGANVGGRYACRCVRCAAGEYPVMTVRRFLEETRDWFAFDAADRINVDYAESHAIFRTGAAPAVDDLAGFAVARAARECDVLPAAAAEDASAMSQLSERPAVAVAVQDAAAI